MKLNENTGIATAKDLQECIESLAWSHEGNTERMEAVFVFCTAIRDYLDVARPEWETEFFGTDWWNSDEI